MISRASIILCARTYVGTPFHHCGRRKGVGIDCGGLVAGVYEELVGTHKSPRSYSRYPDGVTLKKIMDDNCDPTCIKCCGPGDIVGYWYERENVLQHLGILTPIGIVHAYFNAKRCIETSVPEKLQKRLMLAWKFPEVESLDDFEIDDLTDTTDPIRYVHKKCGAC